MSYCRWSSDNFESDIYCYASIEDYFSINVASIRYVSDTPKPEITIRLDKDMDVQEFQRQNKALSDWIAQADRVPIGLPYDGESFSEDDAAGAAARLIELKELGYHVPQYAIDALLEEAKEAVDSDLAVA